MPRQLLAVSLLFVLMVAQLPGDRLHAQTTCEPVVGTVASRQGQVEVERAGTFVWQPASLGEALCEGDSVRAGENSRAALRLINEAVLRLDQNTTIQLSNVTPEPEETSFLDLVAGVIQSFSREPRRLAIDTPYLNATVEGTEFVIAAADRESAVTVLEGVVRAANPAGEVRATAGEVAIARPGEAPVKQLVVRPRDAVQWAIYYPPLLRAGPPPADAPPGVVDALAAYQAGDVSAAFANLETVPEAERGATYQLYRGALLLAVGRVGEAGAAIDRALALDPGSARAQALRAVIAIAQNDPEVALAAAERAVELDPDIAASWIALSYARQARFELEAARDAARRATEVAPDDGLAFARLAELRLALGDRQGARSAAAQATELAPTLAETQTVLGFAALVEFDTRAARAVFGRAIAFDPAAPLPWLGLGLAKIRDGDLAAGRSDLEVAVALDPNNALLRAYLGKAYFEEKRAPLDAEQYAIAEQLDPLDPTAFLYDAIRLQTENRPVQALEQLQRSIELNDNRAVYRSRLLLDSDRASRGASLASIYDNLGFKQVAVQEASSSLQIDPAQPGAHRFLSDALIGVRRSETARVSELLQAQMLQDININPVQPSLSEANLNIIARGGPAEAGLNEYTPLFDQNGVQFDASGLAGTDETFGGEGVVSGLYGPASASAGFFHYQTNGWRPNGDIQHNIANAYGQMAFSPEVNVQVEVRSRETRLGDIALDFDPDDFSETEQRKLDQDSVRTGLRISPNVQNDFLLSFIYSNTDDVLTDTFVNEFGPGTFEGSAEEEGYVVEGQWLYRRERLNVATGLSLGDLNTDLSFLVVEGDGFVTDIQESEDTTSIHPYVYGNLNFPAPVVWTLGLSYDHYEQGTLEVEEVNPKFGLDWSITNDLTLRGAAFQTVKPPIGNNRTLEPTRIAGFNQFFDDSNGDRSRRYGVALDWQPRPDLFAGVELTWRDVRTSFLDFDGNYVFNDRQEQTDQVYINWAPLDNWAFTASFVYDRFEADRSLETEEDVPESLETFSLPLVARYFHPSGFFAGAGVTYVNQWVKRNPVNAFDLAEGRSEFVTVDASAGYRLPRRFGVLSLGVSNLFDTEFDYQDDSFREFQDQPSIGPYIPARQIVGRVTLNW